MARKKVKILKITSGGKPPVAEQEIKLAQLLNDGWQIVTAGGGTGRATADTIGFVILVKEPQTGTQLGTVRT